MKQIRWLFIFTPIWLLTPPTIAQSDSTSVLAYDYFKKSFRAAAQRNLQKAIVYADSCKLLYQEIGDPWGIAQYSFLEGIQDRIQGEYATARDHFNIYRFAMEFHQDTDMLASVHFQLGLMNENLGFLDSAIAHQYQSIAYYESQGNIHDTNDGLNNLGSIYRKLKQYEKSEELYLRSLKINRARESNAGQATNHVNLGNLYGEQNQFVAAIKEYEKAIFFDSLDQFHYGLASDYENIGNMLAKQKEYEKALDQHLRALKIRNTLPNINDRAISQQKIAAVYESIGKSNLALQYLDSAQAYVATTQALETERDIAQTKAKVYANLNQFSKAYLSEKRFGELQDSLLNNAITDRVSELNTKYETAKNEKEIALLNADKKLQASELRAARRQLLGLLVGLVLLVGLLTTVLYLYRQTKSQKEIISEALDEKEILLREIHHRVKNNLQFISSLLGLQTEHIEDPSALGALQEGQDRVQSMALIHQNLYQEDNLKGVQVKDYFVKLIRGLFDSYNIRKDQVELKLHVADLNLDVDSVVPIGLIANELISNSLKYAFENQEKKGLIEVELFEEEKVLILQIQDNGRGISQQDLPHLGTSFGYRLIHVLSQQMDGELQVENGTGTKVTLRVKKYSRLT